MFFFSETCKLSCNRGRALTKPFQKMPFCLCWNNGTQTAGGQEGGEVAAQYRRVGDDDQNDKL